MASLLTPGRTRGFVKPKDNKKSPSRGLCGWGICVIWLPWPIDQAAGEAALEEEPSALLSAWAAAISSSTAARRARRLS